mmetsp:Transcript_9331/g.16512  ORF Transcript_9331/g.16512 Transcript_9331/m.16512 type:complete len:172 (+) Transcript_9331:56-571(+)
MESTPEMKCTSQDARSCRTVSSVDMVKQFAVVVKESCPSVREEQLWKKVMLGIRLMHACRYKYADVVLTLTYASVYMRRALAVQTKILTDSEVANLCVLCMYLAHSFVLDSHTKLQLWHKYVFRSSGEFKKLDAQVFDVFRTLDFKLRVLEDEENQVLRILLQDSGTAHDS